MSTTKLIEQNRPLSTHQSKILIVDDEPIIRELICFLLTNDGHHVLEAGSGNEAIEIVNHENGIDLVLLDLSMPGVDGFEVLNHIRAQKRLADSAVIIVTSNDDSEQTVKAFEQGANDYITKPIDLDIASIRINNQLNLKRAQADLIESRERYDLAASGANDGLWDWNLVTDEIYASSRWKEIIGLKCGQQVDSPNYWLDRIHPDDRGSFEENLSNNLEGQTDNFEHEHRICLDDGTIRWVLCRGMAMRGKDGRAHRIAGWLSDITQGKMVDGLTGLSNRNSFAERIESCIKRVKRNPELGFAVLFIDLDNFKLINDSHGHDVGDEFLKVIAQRLQASIRQQGSLVARIGGDEFTITVEDIPNCEPAKHVSNRIVESIAEPIRIANQTIFPSMSIGISFSKDANTSVEDVIREADTAMYQAKSNGKGCYQVFDPSMHKKVQDRLRIDSEMRDGISKNEFENYYQPIVDMETGRVVALEALLRWNHPTRGLVGPAEFIQVAEETSLIVTLGDIVLSQTCRQLVQWKSQNAVFSDVTCNVNLSRAQLKNVNFKSILYRALQESNLDPKDLQLEITESSLFDNRSNATQLLTEIRKQGIRIALDDFGTGYSSLACLHQLPLDTLKIDRSFVSQMLSDNRSESIVRAIIMLAEGLQLKVCAEGIETIEQQQYLAALECPLAQGYFFARPMPAEAFYKFCVEQNKLEAE